VGRKLGISYTRPLLENGRDLLCLCVSPEISLLFQSP
jgi:hypothetical protein